MHRKIAKRAVAVTFIIVVIAAIGQSAHAQATITANYDRASYVPGDSGTLTISVVNPSSTNTLELRNLTIYFPWAQLVNGKWPSGVNVTINLSPFVELGSLNSGSNIYTTSQSFTIPSWYGGSILGSNSVCPRVITTRYGMFQGCIILGYTANPPSYESETFGIVMALATYTPTSIISEWLPIATLVVLVIATALLALLWTSMRRMPKKQ
jgi:hypothetical protein